MQKTPTVLVADDDDSVRTFVRAALVAAGLNVCEASNGKEALEQFTLHRPDIIVLDVMMPVMMLQLGPDVRVAENDPKGQRRECIIRRATRKEK